MVKTQVLKYLPGATEGERGVSKAHVSGGATDTEAIEKYRYVRIIERKEVRRDDPIEYFLPARVERSRDAAGGQLQE